MNYTVNEKIIVKRLIAHLKEYNLILVTRSSFRNGYSTTIVLTKVVGDSIQAMDNSEVAFLALLDYSTAFDSINHTILLSEL